MEITIEETDFKINPEDIDSLSLNQCRQVIRTLLDLIVSNEKLLHFTGLKDKNGMPIHEGDTVEFYYRDPNQKKGSLVQCVIVWNVDRAMYSLKWNDGYINPYPLNPEKYVVVKSNYKKL